MSLTEYKRKRDFRRTPEPGPKKAARKGWSFVVQKHDASRLHYDFRLELDGVLKSWAVPKGPSLDPKQKRLAMHVEDHPVDYGGFEGVIPEGEYGGGTVMLWDRGHWEPVGDPREGYREGKLKFQLHGEKLQGGFMLVRTGGRYGSSSRDQEKSWLLIKERDDEARPVEEGDILEEQNKSVATGRDLDEIAAARDRVWGSNRSNGKAAKKSTGRGGKKAAARQTKSKKSAARRRSRGKPISAKQLGEIAGVREGSLPRKLQPQLATLTKGAPDGEQWLHEIKFDGYRMLCRIDGEKVEFTSRNQQSWTGRLKHLAEAARRLPVRQALLDGEVVAMEPGGATDFQLLQNVFREGRVGELLYYAFDVLYLDGHDLTKAALEDRKQVLQRLLESFDETYPIRFTEHLAGKGPVFFKQVCKMGLEGIISKRRDRPFLAGRGYDWLKIKCVQKDEFVIGGYTEPGGSRTAFGALLLGYHDDQEELRYAGKVGTGFDEGSLTDLLEKLKPLEQKHSPFSDVTVRKGPVRTAHWVQPRLVAQIEYSNWTRDGMLRHPSFQGLREDKPADEVGRDEPVPVEKAMRKSAAAKTTSANGKKPKKSGSDASARKTPRKKRSRGASSDALVGKDQFAGVRLTSPDKVLYPNQGITKLDLARYYYEVGEWMLPHIAGRPLVLVRCPEGREKECFYQKHPGVGVPENLRQIPIREKSKSENYVVVDDVSGLISLAQIGSLEIHAWGSREDKLEHPDRLIFDLDPDPTVAWERVVESALQIRQFLEDLGLESFVKTTGGKGLHLVVPIQRRHDWDEAKEFCKRVAEAIVAADPKRYTSNMSKAARGGKIFVDYLRNGRGATSVAAFSTRAKPGAPVSVPLTWKELSPQIRSDQFNVLNLFERLNKLKRDPWEEIDSVRQSLSAAVRKKVGM